MKPLTIHLLAASAAAAAGWFAGLPARDGDAAHSTRRIATMTATTGTGAVRAAEWKTSLAAVRRAAGAASEPAWIRWALAIPDEDVPAAIARLNPQTDLHALRCLYARWTRLNPTAAWASFLKSEIPQRKIGFYLPDDVRHRENGMVYSTLYESPRSQIAGRMLTTWMATDGKAARAFAAKLRDPSSPEAKAAKIERYELDRAAGEQTFTPDSGDAAARASAALALEDATARGPATEKALNKWLQKDPAAALRWIQDMPAEARKQLRFEYFAWAARGANPAERAAAFTAMLLERGVPADQIREIAANSGKSYDDYSGDSQGLVHSVQAAREWAAADPSAARAWLAAQPDNDLTSLLTGSVAAGVVAKDPSAALAMLNAMPGDQSLAVRPLVQEWAKTDARAALSWAGKIEDAPLREASMEMAAIALAAADPVTALESAGGIQSDDAKRRIYEAVRHATQWNPAGIEALRQQFPGEAWDGPRPQPGGSGG